MTIQDLIDLLQTCPPDDTVVFSTATLNTQCIHPGNLEVANKHHVGTPNTSILLLKP